LNQRLYKRQKIQELQLQQKKLNHIKVAAVHSAEQECDRTTVFTQIQIKAALKISTKPSVAETTEKLKTNQRTSPSITCVPPNSRHKIQDYCWVLT